MREVPFKEALYESRCVYCSDKLYWQLDADADNPNYYSDCCDIHYNLSIDTVIFNWDNRRED